MKPKKPLQAVSAYLHPKMRIGGTSLSTEVVLVIDADGDLWRLEGAGKWEKVV